MSLFLFPFFLPWGCLPLQALAADGATFAATTWTKQQERKKEKEMMFVPTKEGKIVSFFSPHAEHSHKKRSTISWLGKKKEC